MVSGMLARPRARAARTWVMSCSNVSTTSSCCASSATSGTSAISSACSWCGQTSRVWRSLRTSADGSTAASSQRRWARTRRGVLSASGASASKPSAESATTRSSSVSISSGCSASTRSRTLTTESPHPPSAASEGARLMRSHCSEASHSALRPSTTPRFASSSYVIRCAAIRHSSAPGIPKRAGPLSATSAVGASIPILARSATRPSCASPNTERRARLGGRSAPVAAGAFSFPRGISLAPLAVELRPGAKKAQKGPDTPDQPSKAPIA